MSKITSLTRLRARVRGALMVRRPAQILVMFAFGIVAMMAFAGFAIDTGMLLTTRRNFQKVADICATVGAQAIPGGGAIARAQDCITTNNVSGGATVNVPPTSGLKAGNNRYVEVVIDQNVRTYFLQAVGIRTVPIGVRAVGSAYRALEYAVVGLRPDTNSVRTSGGSSSRIIGNACSRNDFQVSGTLNITGWAVANGSFSGLPSATGTESGPGSTASGWLVDRDYQRQRRQLPDRLQSYPGSARRLPAQDKLRLHRRDADDLSAARPGRHSGKQPRNDSFATVGHYPIQRNVPRRANPGDWACDPWPRHL